MKKNTMMALVSYLNDKNDDYMMDIKAELEAELNKGAEKAQANRNLYEPAHDVIVNALFDTPVTIAELYEEIKDALPEGFTKSKVQYAVTHLWQDEIVKHEGKVNSYTRAM